MASNFPQRTDFKADTQVALTDQFKRTVMLKIAAVMGRQVQDLENTIFAVLNGRGLESAIGAQLDGLGALVGEARVGRTDSVYRIWIGARIRLNLSSGTPNQILELVRILIAVGAGNPILTEYPPAHFTVETVGALTNDEATQIAAIAFAAVPAGVGADFIYSNQDNSGSFLFADTATLEVSTAQGFSDNNPDGIGGAWAGLLAS